MDVSVVIPALNEETTIGRCLDSLTRQTGAGDEIIVLDNGSTDRTGPVAQAFDGVEVLHIPDADLPGDGHYRGLSALRQFGAEKASNPIVVTTDADTDPPAGWLDRIRTHFEGDDDLVVLWGIAQDTNGVPVRNLTGKYLTFLGGVAGSNTAFRKEAFERLEKGYMGWPMFEDVALVTRLARTGKAVHDSGLVMRTDLDRKRYQTIPLLATGGVSALAGMAVGGPVGAVVGGTGMGLVGTESFYDDLPETRFHHDQAGLGLVALGTLLGGTPGMITAGLGTGILGHHLLTEGASALPTDLMQNTDIVCYTDDDGEQIIACEVANEDMNQLTRVLAAVAVGAVGGKLLQVARGG